MYEVNGFVWIGVFLMVIVFMMTILKPSKSKTPSGPFDNSIHSKPVFKGFSILILVIIVQIQ